jgi:hypothetical protein
MRNTFPAYYQPDEAWFKALWADSTIVLDANVLLNLYRYPAAARDDLLALLKQFSDRLVIPYQAAIEYQRGRLGVIASQRSRFGDVRKILIDTESKLEADLEKLQLRKRHSSIAPDQLLAEIHQTMEKFRSELEVHEKKQADVLDDDVIRATLDELLKGKISPPPDQVEIDRICEEGNRRYKDLIPPGFEDEDKENQSEPVFISNGLRIERKFGDLLLWKQIISIASSRKLNSVIFVTDDKKPDWWRVVHSNGKKIIGPRPELTEEIRRDGNVENFYIYNSERFMQSASSFLGITVPQESINQIGDIRKLFKESGQEGLSLLVEDAVHRWLLNQFPGATVTRNEGFPDFRIDLKNGGVTGYDVRRVSVQTFVNKNPEAFRRRELSKKTLGLDSLCFVLVARNESYAEGIKAILPEWLKQMPNELVFLVGYMRFSTELSKSTFVSLGAFNGSTVALVSSIEF